MHNFGKRSSAYGSVIEYRNHALLVEGLAHVRFPIFARINIILAGRMHKSKNTIGIIHNRYTYWF